MLTVRTGVTFALTGYGQGVMGGCVMASGQGSSGSFRERQAEQRAREQAARLAERQRKARERERAGAEAVARDKEAVARTGALERRLAELEGLLHSSLARDPRISLMALQRRTAVTPLDLGDLAVKPPAPQWGDFQPDPPRGPFRILGSQKRYEAAVEVARQAFTQAEESYRLCEVQRREQAAEVRRTHYLKAAEAERDDAAFNGHIAQLAAGVHARGRYAVSEYIQMVLDRSPYPAGLPVERSAGYVPESSLLAVEWYLPPPEVVPEQKAFRHFIREKMVKPVPRPVADARRIYQSIIAQIALRTLREIFDASDGETISTVVFNGRVHAVDPRTGQKIRPHLITLRGTREQFSGLVLNEPRFNPVDCVRKYFYADISKHPDELDPVEPVMPYSMADPRIVDSIDIISDIDKRPNLLELTSKEFEAFIENLFARMGFDTKLYRASGDGGIDCIAYDPHPITGGKFIVQAKLYTKTVQPTHVRDLWGTVQHEGATKGIMITTSGYGPDSYKFAGGKPLNLIDGSGLLSICQQHEIPARILNRLEQKPKK